MMVLGRLDVIRLVVTGLGSLFGGGRSTKYPILIPIIHSIVEVSIRGSPIDLRMSPSSQLEAYTSTLSGMEQV